MKKLLLILLCLPMIGFGQDDCGKKPRKPFNKSSREYKEYKIKYDLWIECKEKADSNALYKFEFPIDEKTNLIAFKEVIQAEGRNKNELYSIYREWFVDRFNSADDVLQMEDKESGKLIGKAFQDITTATGLMPITEKLHYTIKFTFKENRFMYQITNLNTQMYPWQYDNNPSKTPCERTLINNLYKKNGSINKILKSEKEAVLNAIFLLIDDIKNTLQNNISIDENDNDW
ncbi:DUF4468 domain-containing protein [Flavobacteriales bacterium]|nr:DUF4468 domain-containing protein [Flavobacteriales bacterium]